MEPSAVVLDQLRTVLSDATSVPLSCWNRDELADWLCGLQDIRAQVDGLLCSAAAEGESAALYQLDRVRSLRQFVALRTGTNPADVGADLALGTWMVAFPAVSHAMAGGRITRRHAQTLRELDNPRTHQALLAGIDYLVESAADCSWEGFIEVCNEWLANADPDGTLPDERIRNRRLSTKRRADGSLSGQFNLDTVAGEAVKNAIEREALRLFRIDADPTNPEYRNRHHAQRLADALVNLVTRGAIRKDGTVGAPLVHVVVGLDILEEAICRKAATDAGVLPIGPDGQPLGDNPDIDPKNPLRRCELVDGTPIHPYQVLAMLDVATLRRLVLGADSEILDIGRGSRDFPDYMKQAGLAASRGRCAEHGCDAPPSWLQADHIVPWKPAGRTATRNLQMLCSAANHAKSNRTNPPPRTTPARSSATTPPAQPTTVRSNADPTPAPPPSAASMPHGSARDTDPTREPSAPRSP